MTEVHSATTFQAPAPEHLAELFPAFDIHRLIACGGMGAVYHATQRSLDREVAIKILPREFSADAAFCAGFESEAKAMARLNHPNLIGVYDFGEVEGMLFIVMEYVAGKSLFHSAHGHAVDPGEAIRLTVDVARGLHHAHEHGILHRDIKPSNILLDAQARPKIGDFGLARAQEIQVQEGDEIFGTPGYTAPEVLEPPYTIDHHADIFSVGVLLHEMLTGKLPGDDPRPASQIVRCDSRLDAVIRRATHPNPAARHATAAELADELAKIASSGSRAILSGAAVAPRPHATKRVAKESSSGLGVTLFLVAVAAAAAFFVLNKKPAAPVRPSEATDSPPETVVVPVAPPTRPVPQATAPPAASGFDVPEFLSRHRSAVRQRIAPLIEASRRELEKNLGAYESEISGAIRSLDPAIFDSVRVTMEENIKEWRSRGNVIPTEVPAELAAAEGAAAIHQRYLAEQNRLRESLFREIAGVRGIYLLGLEDQIDKLDPAADQAAIGAIQGEIEQVKGDPAYLQGVVLE